MKLVQKREYVTFSVEELDKFAGDVKAYIRNRVFSKKSNILLFNVEQDFLNKQILEYMMRLN